MNFVEQARLWSHHQQQLGKRSRNAEQALREIVAVYSAHPSAPLSLFPRVKGITANHFRALEVDRRAVRLGAMRGSIHLMPRDTAPLLFAANQKQTPKMLALRLKVAKVTPAEYEKFKKEILKTVNKPVTVRELRRMTGEAEAGLGTLLRAMSDEGLVLRVGAQGLRSNELLYAPTKLWLGELFPERDRDQALRWLAGEYLRAFGPVRLQDFMWWTGSTKTAAVSAFEPLDTVDAGQGYLLLREHEKQFARVKPFTKDAVDVLPKWDCYTMGYAPDGRVRFVTPDTQGRIYDKVGDGVGTILLNGLAIAAWDLRAVKDKLDVNIDWFEKPDAAVKSQVKFEIDTIAAFLESNGVDYRHLGDEHESRTLGRMR